MTEDTTHLKRRNMLQALGGTATVTGLAGCLGGDGGDSSSDDGSSDDGSSGDGGSDDGSSDNGSSDDGGSDDGEENGEEENGEESGEEEDNIVPVMEGTVFESDGETKIGEGQLTLIDRLGDEVATHDLSRSAEFRLTGLKLGETYELQIIQTERYPDQQATFVAEPPEGFAAEQEEDGDSEGDSEEDSGDEERIVQVQASVQQPSIINPETNNITMQTGVAGTDSYAWEGRLQFQTDRRTGEWIHRGARAANRNAYVIDNNLVRSQRRDEDKLKRVFLYREVESIGDHIPSDDPTKGTSVFLIEPGVAVIIDGEEYIVEELYRDNSGVRRLRLEETDFTPKVGTVDIIRGALINPIKTGTTCKRQNNAGGYPNWTIHRAVQEGLVPFDDFEYKRRETIDHPDVFDEVRTKVYEVDPAGSPLTFELYAHNRTGDVMRIDGDFHIADIDREIFEGELLTVRGEIEFMGHGEDRFIGANRC